MGVYVNGRCYSSSSLGVDALFSSVLPDLSSSCFSYLSRDSSGQWLVNYSCSSQPVVSYPAPIPDFLECQPLDSISDGMALAFLVAAVWASAWVINVLRRCL